MLIFKKIVQIYLKFLLHLQPSPVPPRPQPAYTEAFAPEQQSYQPQYNPVPQQPQPIQQQPQRPTSYAPKQQSRGTSILDQLQKDFAIPQSSAALHDISFGYSLQ